jgi:hypothetical protein
MSASVVAHEETLTRMADRPRHTVLPHQHVPCRWTASITSRVRFASPSAEHLPEDDVVEDLEARRPRAFSQPHGKPGAALHELGYAAAAKRSQGGPRLDAASLPRELGHEACSVAAVAMREIGGAR